MQTFQKSRIRAVKNLMTSLFEKITEAHHGLRPRVLTTPLEYSSALSRLTGCEVYLKCEHLQRTGSFKFRGASNKLRLLSPSQREKGVVTASSGNHGLAMAMAARSLGTEVEVYVPEHASPAKTEAIRLLGAKLVHVPGDALAAELTAMHQAGLGNKAYVPPYNDSEVIAGQGTIAMEMLEQENNFDAVFVSVGGGGMISGIGTAFRARSPRTEIVGCWPANAPSMHASLAAGRIVEIVETDTISDGTAGGIEPDAVTFRICQQVIDHCALVTETEIRNAMRLLAASERWMVEGAAGVAMAGMLQNASRYQGQRVAIVLCGRNISLEKYLEVLTQAPDLYSQQR